MIVNLVPMNDVLRIYSVVFKGKRHGDISKIWLWVCREGFTWANRRVVVRKGGQWG
jgi:hypothetical protein